MAAADCVTVITKGLVTEPPATSTKTTTEKSEKIEERVLITPTSSSSNENGSDEAEASTSGLLRMFLTFYLYECTSIKFIDRLIAAFLK